MGKKRVFTKEFKERAVELAHNSERAQSGTARDFGVGMSTLSRWKLEAAQAETRGLKAFPCKGAGGGEKKESGFRVCAL
jgi:transposase-like protein